MVSLTRVVVDWLLARVPWFASSGLLACSRLQRPIKCWFQVSRCSKAPSTTTFKPLLYIMFANVPLDRSLGQTQFKGLSLNRISFLMGGSTLPQGGEGFAAIFPICSRILGYSEGCRVEEKGRERCGGGRLGSRDNLCSLHSFSWDHPYLGLSTTVW